MCKAIVYRITNEASGKSYIGVTTNPQKRLKDHLYSGNYGSKLIKKALQKYPLDCFVTEVLLVGELGYCYEMEARLISGLNTQKPNGYNIAAGGDRGPNLTGFKHIGRKRKAPRTAEESERKSASQRGALNHQFGKKQSLETIEKKRKAALGNKSRLGQKQSDEERLKKSLATKGRPKSEEWKAKVKASWARKKEQKFKGEDLGL